MSESADYSPAPYWKGHDFKSARRAYADIVDRSYADAVTAGVTASDLVPRDDLRTDAESPLMIVCDVTGSMGEWPAVIFSKLPYLEHECGEYLGDNVEISFAAVGDAPCSDKFPLQVRPFAKGADLKPSLEKLVHEKGGGGTMQESYDLAALYYARRCHCPNAIRKPILIFIGDEGIYEMVDGGGAQKFAGITLEGRMTSEAIFAELVKKYAVYVVRKPYGDSGGNRRSSSDERIQEQWEKFLGADHVIALPDPNRVVDCIFGILGVETGKFDYFRKELEDRQGKDKDGDKKINVVMKSLHSIHDAGRKKSLKKLPPPKAAKSVSLSSKAADGKKSVSLMDDPRDKKSDGSVSLLDD